MKKELMLQIFAEPEGNDPGTGAAQNAPANNTTGNAPAGIDYDRLAQIIAGKQSATEDSVIKGYLKQQGLSAEEMTAAIASFKAERAKNDPAKKIADLQEKIDQYEHEKVLAKKNVRAEDYDYVLYKAQKLVDDKTNFEKAVDTFLKENPRFVNGNGSYRVDTGAGNTGNHQGGNNGSGSINDMIRKAFGK